MGQTVGRKGMDNCTKCTFELRADADICKTSPCSSGGHIMVTFINCVNVDIGLKQGIVRTS